MINLHQPTQLLNLAQIAQIENALITAWCKETAYPEIQGQWSEDNKALGQCLPTAVLIQDLIGGRMIYDKVNFHIWNELPDKSQHDFSRIQFPNETIFKIHKYKTKEDLLFDKNGIRTKANERYELLKKRFEKNNKQPKV